MGFWQATFQFWGFGPPSSRFQRNYGAVNISDFGIENTKNEGKNK
jgi:hypothetical protein